MNRAELIDQIRDRLGVDKKAAENAVDVVFDTIQRAVAAGEKVALTGFGVFEKVDRAARTGRNPRTGASVKIKKTSVPKFRPGTQFKGVVSGAVKLGKVADTATKAAAKSVGDSARSTARTAAAAPGKATAAARGAAKKTSTAPAKKTAAKAAAPAKSSANGAKKTAGATKSAANGAKKTAAKKAPAKKAAKR